MSPNNPWVGFKHSDEMVHPLDIHAVRKHNQSSKPDYQFLLHLAPEPWIGNLKGNLLVLYANPGATQDNLKRVIQKNHSKVMEKSIKNLNQTNIDFPHFHFDPELSGTEGSNWFESKYKWVLNATSRQELARNLITCELAPYHSVKWKVPKVMPRTQEFTFQIIREGIERGAVILLARSARLWTHNIPELLKYDRVYRPNSINASISPNNYPDSFDKIIDAVTSRSLLK